MRPQQIPAMDLSKKTPILVFLMIYINGVSGRLINSFYYTASYFSVLFNLVLSFHSFTTVILTMAFVYLYGILTAGQIQEILNFLFICYDKNLFFSFLNLDFFFLNMVFTMKALEGEKKEFCKTFISNFPIPIELLTPTDRVKIGLEYLLFFLKLFAKNPQYHYGQRSHK